MFLKFILLLYITSHPWLSLPLLLCGPTHIFLPRPDPLLLYLERVHTLCTLQKVTINYCGYKFCFNLLFLFLAIFDNKNVQATVVKLSQTYYLPNSVYHLICLCYGKKPTVLHFMDVYLEFMSLITLSILNISSIKYLCMLHDI